MFPGAALATKDSPADPWTPPRTPEDAPWTPKNISWTALGPPKNPYCPPKRLNYVKYLKTL